MADLQEFWKRARQSHLATIAEEDQLIARAIDMIHEGGLSCEEWADSFMLIDAMRESTSRPVFERVVSLFAMIGYREVLRRM